MSDGNSKEAIPEDTALQICNEIQKESHGKLFSFASWQCWGCLKFSKGDVAKMCFAGRSDYRGCNLVNKRYESRGL